MGLLPLVKRRKFHRLVQIYKIVHKLCPNYLQILLPPTAAERNPYPLRDESLITLPLCRTEHFRNSFYPSTIRDWNALPIELRQAQTVASFKSNLSKLEEFKVDKPPMWYSYGNRHLNITLTRIRNNCSALGHDLFVNHVLINPTCQNCNLNLAEDAHHYFLICPKFENIRQTLLDSLTAFDLPLDVPTITSGSMDINYDRNKLLIDSIHSFIRQSNRFPQVKPE